MKGPRTALCWPVEWRGRWEGHLCGGGQAAVGHHVPADELHPLGLIARHEQARV